MLQRVSTNFQFSTLLRETLGHDIKIPNTIMRLRKTQIAPCLSTHLRTQVTDGFECSFPQKMKDTEVDGLCFRVDTKLKQS